MTSQSFPADTRDKTTIQATIVGVVLQLAMVAIGHAVPGLRAMWGPGGTLISLVVGVWAAWSVATMATAVAWGAIAGGLGALVGIGLAVVLGDVPVTLLFLGTAASTVAGIVGAAVTHKLRAKG
jgi:hypothetical protein